MTGSFRRLGERAIYEGHVISLAVGTFEAPDRTVFERDIVHHPGAVSVVPLLDDGTVVMVRQYRAALETDLLEIPAGKRDVPDEDPALTAQRELAEEIGFQASSMELLARFYNSPGFCDEASWVYLGTGLVEAPMSRHSIEEHAMTIEHVRLDDVPALIAAGDLRDAKSIIGLLLARERLDRS